MINNSIKGPEANISNLEFEKAIQEKEEALNNQNASSTKKSQQPNNNTQIHRIEAYISSKYILRKNLVRNYVEIKDLSKPEQGFKVMGNFEANITVDLMKAGFKAPQTALKALLYSDFIPDYHPVQNYFLNLKAWDGIDRIKDMAGCLIAEDSNDQTEIEKHFKKHLVRCVKSAFINRYFNKHCFVIIGTEQSMGKSTFIRSLIPAELSTLSSDSTLDMKTKDAIISLGSNWIINLDELANLNKSEIGALKATLSTEMIKVRKPYDRVETETKRLANFFGSTNDIEFLTDLTGNVRWICFRIKKINWVYSVLDIDQIWAQAYHEFKNKNFNAELTDKEIIDNESRNDQFMLVANEVEALQQHFRPCNKDNPRAQFASTTIIMSKLNYHGFSFRNKRLFGQALKSLDFIKCSKRVKNGDKKQPVYGYYFIEENIEFEEILENE